MGIPGELMKCDLCPYERVVQAARGLPYRFRRVLGFVLCPQCQEMSMNKNEEPRTNRAFAYLRASTSKQEMTIEAQRERIQAYCDYRGLEIVDFFCDKASASKNMFVGRTAGRQIYASAQEGDHVIFAKYDRGFRNVADCLEMYERWTRKGIYMHFACENGLVPPTPLGKFILTMMVAAAEYESGMMSDRQKEVNRVRRKNLVPTLSNFPYTGFVFTETGEKKNGKKIRDQILNEDELPLAAMFHDWKYKDGYPFVRIVEMCEEQKIRVPASARQYDDRIQRKYTRSRVSKLVFLEAELRQVKQTNPSKKWTLKELGDEWKRMFYATGRTRVTLSGNGRKNRIQTPLSDIVNNQWGMNGVAKIS